MPVEWTDPRSPAPGILAVSLEFPEPRAAFPLAVRVPHSMFSDVFEKLVAARGRLDRESGAKAVKLSGSRFSHVFRQRTGMSWRAAETAIRLELSAHTVVLTDWRLSEIAHLFEYSELKSWSESFDKHFGLRPRDYRRLCAYLLPRGLPGCRYVISQHLGR